MYVRLVLSVLVALLALGWGYALGEEEIPPAPDGEVIPPHGVRPGEDREKARREYIEERLGDRKARMDDRTRRKAEREDLLRSRHEASGPPFFYPRVRAKAGLSLVWPEGSLLKEGTSGTGTELGLGSDLGAGGIAVAPALEVEADLSPDAGLGFDLSYHVLWGEASAGDSWVYHGTAFMPGERVETTISDLVGGGGVHYRFYRDAGSTLWVRAGAVYWNQRVALRRSFSPGKLVETMDAFFPFLGVRGEFGVGRGTWFETSVELGYLGFGENDYRQSNRMLSFAMHLSFRLFEHGRLRLGYVYLLLEADREEEGRAEESALALHGLSVDLAFRFY